MATTIAEVGVPRGAGMPDRLTIWTLGFIVWTALALLSAFQTAIAIWYDGGVVSWSRLLPRNLIDWYTCAVFTPVYFWMVRRWPLRWTSALPTLGIYALITVVIVVLKYMLYVPLINLISQAARPWTLGGVLTTSFIRENVAFWCMLAVILAWEYYRTEREREMREARMQTQLAEARLDVLSAQLHPHFLFNTIQGISTLIHRDPAAADTMLARLSTMLRHTLQRDAGHEVPLEQELELLDLYLGIVQERFRDRLTVNFQVAPDTRAALVPRFLLQPLVENALHHGIARSPIAGTIDISSTRIGDQLEIAVSDDGPGYVADARALPASGIGLGNTRDRLAQLYGDRQSLDIKSGSGGGFAVVVRIPWHRAEDA